MDIVSAVLAGGSAEQPVAKSAVAAAEVNPQSIVILAMNNNLRHPANVILGPDHKKVEISCISLTW